MAMALPVQLDVEMALRYHQAGRRTCPKKAHDVLKELRAELTARATEPGDPLGYTQEAHVAPLIHRRGDLIGRATWPSPPRTRSQW
jgi:hypothetical protein